MSAYDIQREIENRSINRWVKISTPSIYKKITTYQDKGFVTSYFKYNGAKIEKTMYAITDEGIHFYKQCAQKLAEKDVNLFFDFNAVITNFDNFNTQEQIGFLTKIDLKIAEHLMILENKRSQKETIPEFGKQIFKQQYALLLELKHWIEDYLKEIK